jgi:hypothetical protein
MKTLLIGIGFALVLGFASQAFALPYCTNGAGQSHYACTTFDE